jgi:hypothetical protein
MLKDMINLLWGAERELYVVIKKIDPGSIQDRARAAFRNINDAIAKLTSPRFETPERYEKRTWKKWPQEWAVYSLYKDDYGVKYWFAERFMYAYADGHKPALAVVRATEAGKPPDGWEPEIHVT